MIVMVRRVWRKNARRSIGVGLWAAVVAAGLLPGSAVADEPAPTQAERMAELGLVRYRGGWRTRQEIELLERDEAATIGQKQWTAKLERLRRQLEQPAP